MTERFPARIQVGDWSAEHCSGRLRREAEERVIEPKVMDLLFLLASEPNRVFLKEEIHDRLWPGVTVGEDSLARCVWKLRKALDDDPAAPRFVETIAKRGYRLIAPIGTPQAERAPAPRRRLSVPLLWSGATAAALLLAFAVGRFAASPPATAVYPAGTAAEEADEARLRRLAETDRAEAAGKAR